MTKNSDFGAGIIDEVLFVMASIPVYDPNEPYSDVFGLRASAERSTLPDAQLVTGTVHLVFPYVSYAKLQGDHGRGVIRCFTGSLTQVPNHLQAFHVSADLDTNIGTLVHKTPQNRILSRDSYSDVVVHGSGVGFYAQEVYRKQFDTYDNCGVLDFNTGEPFDQLPGDWGHIFSTGVGIHADELMLFMRVSETCGVFGYYIDSVLRIAGEQLEIESDAHLQKFGNDTGELYQESSYFYTPWEMQGFFDPNYQQDNIKTNDPAKVAREGGFVWEPNNSDQKQFARFTEYGGYLSQGSLLVCGAISEDIKEITQSDLEKQSGLAKQYFGVGGQVLIESAKRITIAKSAVGYVPVRKQNPDSTAEEADNLDNYKFSGVFGEGDDHVYKDLRPTHEDPHIRAAGDQVYAMDLFAIDSAYSCLHVFAQHKNDFAISSPATLQENAGLDFSSLSSSDRILPPAGSDLHLDRDKLQKLFQLASLIQLTDEGAIIIQEAMGGSITLKNGVITLSGTSIRLHGGKAVHIAGGRVISRSVLDTDILSGHGRVRIKSEKDFMLVAACGGTGGVLIENRGTGATHSFPAEPDDIQVAGVVIKSSKTPFQVLSAGTYIRSGIDAAKVSPGDIILDAAAGKSNIITRSSEINQFVSSHVWTLFGTSPNNISIANVSNSTYSKFGAWLGIDGSVVVSGGIQAQDNIISAGVVGTAQYPQKVKDAVNQMNKQLEDDIKRSREVLTSRVEVQYEKAGKAGNNTTAASISFGFPSSDRYNAGKVVFAEPYWQKLVNATSSNIAQGWQEPVVKYKPDRDSRDTHAWPGQEAWSESKNWVKSDDTKVGLFDVKKQTPKHPVTDKEKYLTVMEQEELPLKTDTIANGLKYLP
jgi:hypothetical protein